MSFWNIVKLLKEPAGRLATDVIPKLIETIRRRRAAGDSDQVIIQNITSRLDEVASLRAKRNEKFDDKFGRGVEGSD